MKTKVQVIFPANEPDKPSWPYVGYDVKGRSKVVLSRLRSCLPEMEFSSGIYLSLDQAKQAFQHDQGQFDGYLVYMTAMWTGIPEFFVQNVHPIIVADELYSGSGGFLKIHSFIQGQRLPVVGVASSDFQDTIDAVRLIDVMKKMRQSRILVVADDETWGADRESISKTADIFGSEVTRIDSDRLKAYYNEVDAGEAEFWKDEWVRGALKVVEPDEEELLRSARMYLALKSAVEQANAEAITVDCLGLYSTGKLFAYPCLGFFQLNNDGKTGVCEADLDSTLTQLLIRYATGRGAYVSDPVIDVATGQIIYAHCVATNRPFGPSGAANPYIIRSHAEDRAGASVQSLLPVGKTITSIKISVENRIITIHTARTVGNINDDKACRTKLAAEVDAQKVLDNYHFELTGWHRVTVYGDYRRDFCNLARLYGLRLIEEDR